MERIWKEIVACARREVLVKMQQICKDLSSLMEGVVKNVVNGRCGTYYRRRVRRYQYPRSQHCRRSRRMRRRPQRRRRGVQCYRCQNSEKESYSKQM